MDLDALVVGGGPAGLQAAAMLGRAQRRALVCDVGTPRNAPAAHAHGVFTRDGTPPQELLRLARADLAAYDTVRVRDVAVSGARRIDQGFVVTLATGEELTTRGLVVAAGVRDLLPERPGFREHWGRAWFHCPYCHGYEHRNAPWAVMGNDPAMLRHAALLATAWTDDVVALSDGPLGDVSVRDALSARGIALDETPVSSLEGSGEQLSAIVFADGRRLARGALMWAPPTEPRSRLPEELGAEVGADGRVVQIDPFGQTTVPRLLLAGDLGTFAHSVTNAVASGAMAGAGLNHLLAMEGPIRSGS